MRSAAIVLAGAALLGACGGAARTDAADAAATPSHVVLISLDGFRHDYLELHDAPNLRRLADAGIRAEGLIPIFPSNTYPNHYAVATGQYADTHQLINNDFLDRSVDRTYTLSDRSTVEDGWWYGGEPIWVTAERQGVPTAAFFFPGTEADIGGVRPSRWKRYDHWFPTVARVDSVLDWLRLPATERPRLITLYFPDTDDAGHRHGPESPENAAAVARVDSAIGRLLDGIADTPARGAVNVVVVSDHGMQRIDPDRRIDFSPWLGPAAVRAVFGTGTPVLFVYLEDPAAATTLDAVLDRELPCGARSYRRAELPERWHFTRGPRIPDMVLLAPPPCIFDASGGEWTGSLGKHGYDPAVASMRGLFIAAGPGVRDAGRIPAFENVHVYPFLAALLGVRPNPSIDGDAGVLGPYVRRP